ncbi:amidohydrolase [Epibacterium sp. Ofav1-8]|uniref:amidohydrolase n=1 Tax=Epibacterium sp. Ofav1-8 TaxID=2917735 RepID=UPI001EF47831|nr:amidohydrolase [Epibacterium sp. Ofav1-8]MCG7625169.1 amidohydrolase [Epibacterium sp. Ofav1-8]
MQSKLLLRGANIRTLNPDQPMAEAVLLDGDNIVWVGDDADAPSGCKEFHCNGKTIVPGFVDAHVHLYWIGHDTLCRSYLEAESFDDICDLIRDQARSKGPDEWIFGIGVNDFKLKEGRLPDRHILDAVGEGRPIYLRRFCGHSATCNSAALRIAGIDETTADPLGGQIERDGGAPTGVLREMAMHLVNLHVPKPAPEDVGAAVKNLAKKLLQYGVTGCCEAAVGFTNSFDDEWQVWEQLKADPDYPQRMDFMLRLDPADAVERGLRPAVAHPDWRVATLKFFEDGIVGARTAAFNAPYRDSGKPGMIMYPGNQLCDQVTQAVRDGWQCGIHAIGDLAIAQAANALLEGSRIGTSPGPMRIEHVALPTTSAIETLAEAGAAVVTQPSFISSMGDGFQSVMGYDTTQDMYPVRSLLDRGMSVVFSSDAPAGSLEPLAGMAAAVERQTATGKAFGEVEAITPLEALHLYTTAASTLFGQPAETRSIQSGGLSDLVLLDRDPFSEGCGAADLRETNVVATVSRGRFAYAAPELSM